MENSLQLDHLLGLVGPGKAFSGLGLSTTGRPGTLTFLDAERYAPSILRNPHVTGVITTPELASILPATLPVYLFQNPRHVFYSLHNLLAEGSDVRLPATVIHPRALVHPTSYIAPRGVVIGEQVYIEPQVTIFAGVYIGARSVIRAGARIGVEGFEHKRTSNGILSVRHDGCVHIGEDVEIGPNNTVAKGLMGRDTVIGDQTKLDALVHVAHCVQIGKRCLLPACAMVAGSVSIGDDVWIGPNASVSSQVSLGSGAIVTIGAVVTRDVSTLERVSGNFAIPHAQHLQQLRRQLREMDHGDE